MDLSAQTQSSAALPPGVPVEETASKTDAARHCIVSGIGPHYYSVKVKCILEQATKAQRGVEV
jgi:hypothetical protein